MLRDSDSEVPTTRFEQNLPTYSPTLVAVTYYGGWKRTRSCHSRATKRSKTVVILSSGHTCMYIFLKGMSIAPGTIVELWGQQCA